jgi:hypothetical protein
MSGQLDSCPGKFVAIAGQEPVKIALRHSPRKHYGKLSRAAFVMLRLRLRYVSKAAILTLPVQPVSVENRSSS